MKVGGVCNGRPLLSEVVEQAWLTGGVGNGIGGCVADMALAGAMVFFRQY